MTRKLVFVSYARADEPEHPGEGEVRWLTFVLGYLKAAFVGMEVEVFTDRGLAGGADWSAEIERRLRACDAFVLLVSPHSMTSSFVVEKEIAVVRAREMAGDAPLFVPIMLAPTPEAALDLIRDKNWRQAGGKTLWENPPHERARKMKEVAQEIARHILNKRAEIKRDDMNISITEFLNSRPWPIAIGIAVRAVLRVLPFFDVEVHSNNVGLNFLGDLFRVGAIALCGSRYPNNRYMIRDIANATILSMRKISSDISDYSSVNVVEATEMLARACADSLEPSRLSAASAIFISAKAARNGAVYIASQSNFGVGRVNETNIGNVENKITDAESESLIKFWGEIRKDMELAEQTGSVSFVDGPLYRGASLSGANLAWARMLIGLPNDQDWGVWMDWYAARVRGITRSEAYELTFAAVPEDVWLQGAKAANAWIREHLPQSAAPADLPPHVEGIEAPADFKWDAASLIEQITGFTQAPLFANETSAGDQTYELAAARAACDWLLKVLAKRQHNVGPFYEMRVEAIRDALPASAEKGAILIAYNHALTLREKLIADDGLNDEIRSDAIRIVESVFALCRFYPEVERHMLGVARMKDVDLLPTAALRGFARAVRGAPGVFGPSVSAGLGAVENLGPEGPRPERKPEPPPDIPTPPQTPDADKSADRLKAGWVNALYKTFREGPTVVGATDAWIEAAHKVGEAARPILDWLARSMGG